MKILFTGGYGNISWWCAKKALEEGHEVYILNREQTTSTRREIPKEAIVIKADYRNFNEAKKALEGYYFDIVCDFLCCNFNHAQIAYELFRAKTKQYILISSESVYKRKGIITENSEKYNENEASPYILGKLQAEKFFLDKYESEKFPLTIVCPGYTLDTILPYSIGHNCYTVAKRYLEGKPILIAGSGENKWTFTHSSDFANGFYNVINFDTIGERFNIIGDTIATFNEIMSILAINLVDKNPYMLHIPYDSCLKLSQFMPEDLMEQRMNDAIFDNSKIKSISDWKTLYDKENIVKSTLKWLNEDKKRKRFNEDLDKKLELLTLKYIG